MKTIRPYNVDEMRVKASERIHGMFKNVPFLYVKYKDTFAEGYCQYKDGLMIGFTVWYRDMVVRVEEYAPMSQHEAAMQYIRSIPETAWAS